MVAMIVAMLLPPVPDYQSAQWTRAQQRGEDPPTTFDAVCLCIKALVKILGALTCAVGFVLFARGDVKSPMAPFMVILCGLFAAGFAWQSARAIRRAVRILRREEVD